MREESDCRPESIDPFQPLNISKSEEGDAERSSRLFGGTKMVFDPPLSMLPPLRNTDPPGPEEIVTPGKNCATSRSGEFTKMGVPVSFPVYDAAPVPSHPKNFHPGFVAAERYTLEDALYHPEAGVSAPPAALFQLAIDTKYWFWYSAIAAVWER